MLHKEICSAFAVLVISGICSADEPVRGQNPIKQRVSPKVLREAMNLPEYQLKATESLPAPTLDDMQQLSDKLKKNGDEESASLVQRFLNHHRRLTQKLTEHLQEIVAVPGEKLIVQMKTVEVSLPDLTKATDLRNSQQVPWTAEFEAELCQLILSGKAEILSSVSFASTVNEPEQFHSGGEFLIPTSNNRNNQKFEVRKYGTDVEFLPTLIDKERVQIRMIYENAQKDPAHATTVLGTTVPGITKRRLQSTFEMKLGDSIAHVISASPQARSVLLITKVTKKN